MGDNNFQTVEKNAREASVLLKSMSNETRLLILCILAKGEMAAGDIEHALNMSQSSVSQHLKRLYDDGLVTRRKQAQNVLYSLDGERAAVIITALHQIFCGAAKPDSRFPAEAAMAY
ncbi:MAG: winged helix-turn-helix transcriptional regulator [Alphaproteobacteria bacterium]|nr:winged helix-turn-helix transcriptional regulator [Alphaproteobacteria bacterium]